ncbi:BZ3500_MvSof-1268-A1-R1_Chr3-3g06549 [Microbotryum saponariae]|uniref:BZ3500_MvSof-1268-A1-R1_Chr3-3g06549 protein n=1 Tax=Microbotryum saponariae TaxID=289078 RepID=A0A2X0KVL4_9BASI|nr:BZ3500_MvSof-1268-A1-R1_Chr3-3g06549 [Microbotryum saponariae]SDA04516.1 BZ3501_MvSof-1269-A2-R1_Chr3-2g06236 [Microbotryum saponariae]
MDCLKAIQTYVNKIITNTSGIKVLLLDAETTAIVSLASTQSALLSHEVYLTDRIDNPARCLPASSSSTVAPGAARGASAYPPSRAVERLPHLKCICLLRPTDESIEACERELREGRYGGYWLYFTNVLKKSQIERLAEADEHELVREVQASRSRPPPHRYPILIWGEFSPKQEYFADYSPLTSSHFSLSILPTPLHPSVSQNTMALFGDTPSVWSPSSPALTRHVQGLSALLLSLKKKPLIRYERMSPLAKKLGQELMYQMNEDGRELWDFRKSASAPLLLLLDRRNDPVTPLLSQWTYQAMVHELLGITNGRVSLADAPEVREELKEIVLSPDQDPFFAANLYDNFGDLGAHLSTYVQDYSTKSATSNAKNIETVADMRRFIEEYPEFRKLGGNVSKHVALVGELSRLVHARKLLEVSELEQSLASNESHSSDYRSLQQMITSPDILPEAKLRLAILYALRYQKSPQNNIQGVVDLLNQQAVKDADMVHVMLNFAGADQRQDDLFANENFFTRGKSALKGLKGVENVYTQHTPHLAETIDLLLRGRLKETSYPFIEGQGAGQTGVTRPQEIIIFVIGGTTYEEAKTVASLNAQFAAGHGLAGSVGPGGVGAPTQNMTGTRILLGGTCVHNSRTFLEMTKDAAFSWPAFSNSAALAQRSTLASSTASASNTNSGMGLNTNGPINLNIGPVTLNNVAGGLEAGVDAARDGWRDLVGRVKAGVDQVRLQ